MVSGREDMLVSIARYALSLWCGHSGVNCALCTFALVWSLWWSELRAVHCRSGGCEFVLELACVRLGVCVGLSRYMVYLKSFWQGNHQIYGHIRCIYTVLANSMYV